jgi:hypothetical protein
MTGQDEWRGRVAFILAILAPASVVAIVWLIVVYDDNLTERGSTVLAALLGGLVGALATYLGVLRGKPSSDGDH